MNKFKKLLLSTPIIVALLCPFITASSVFAEDCKGKTGDEYTECMSIKGNTDSSDCKGKTGDEYEKCMAIAGNHDSSCRNFLGLISWDCNVNITNEETLKSGLWQIAANVASDITVIAAYLVIGYVIYGGYLYMLAAGDTGKVATGKKALTQAFIGLAIVMSAHIILATIRVALLGAGGKLGNCATGQCVAPDTVIINAIQWIIGVSGFVAAIFVVYGGISYATSSGEPTKLQKAKQTILYALIGLAIVALAEIITAFVSNIIREANKTALINQTTIAKELHENKTT